MAAPAKRNNMPRERSVEIEYKINRLGVVGRAYYEASQIKLRRNRMLIRAARTENMLLHSALVLLKQKEMAARQQSGDLDGMRKQAKILHKAFDLQRGKSVANQLQLQKQIINTRSAEIECADLLDPNTTILVRIRALDGKLEAIYAQTKDTQIVERFSESLLKPMREEHIVYASQLESLGNILKIKKGETMQLKMLHFDGIRSRDQAKRELEELLASMKGRTQGGGGGGLSAELQARILKAVREIKIVMRVGSMPEMYQKFLFQEKQCTYLAQVHDELKFTLSQLRNEHQAKRKSMAEVGSMVDNTKDMVRRVSTRRHSVPLMQILERTRKLVDKIHQGTLVEDKAGTESPQKVVLVDCEVKLVKLIKGLMKKMKHLKLLEESKRAAAMGESS